MFLAERALELSKRERPGIFRSNAYTTAQYTPIPIGHAVPVTETRAGRIARRKADGMNRRAGWIRHADPQKIGGKEGGSEGQERGAGFKGRRKTGEVDRGREEEKVM